MLYIKAEFAGTTKYVASAEDSSQACNLTNNITELFSQGLHPEEVKVTVEDAAGDVMLVQSAYNGYFKVLELDEKMLEKYRASVV